MSVSLLPRVHALARAVLAAAALCALVLGGLSLAAASAVAASYGPSFDGPLGRVGSYQFDGKLVYCLEPEMPRPLGTTTPAGTAGASRFQVSDLDMARANWAISTHGQTESQVQAAAVQLFVWSTVAPSVYNSHGMSGDDYYIGRLPGVYQQPVLDVLAALREGARYVNSYAPTGGATQGTLTITTDPSDARRGTVRFEGGEPASWATVSLTNAVSATNGSATVTLAPGDAVEIRATPSAAASGSFRISAEATVELPQQRWNATLAVFETPGAQLLGGAGGQEEGSYTLKAEDAAPREPRFEPFVSTAVAAALVGPGSAIIDRWTIARASTAPWLTREDGTFATVTAQATLYGPFDEQPDTQAMPPSDAPVAASGTVTLGGGRQDPTGTVVEVSSAELGAPELASGWYSWVVSIDASEQVLAPGEGPVLPAGYAWQDAFGVQDETALVVPSVRTEAQPDARPGEEVHDVAIIDGVLPEGATIEFAIYEAVHRDGAAVCESPLAVTAALTLEARRYDEERVASPAVTLDEAGEYWWVETLRSAEGEVLHVGGCGVADETTIVTEPTQPPTDTPTQPHVEDRIHDEASSAASGSLAETGRSDVQAFGAFTLAALLFLVAGALVTRERRRNSGS